MRMELRRAIKLALIGHINTSIKKSEAIKQNSIHLLFLDIFVAIIDGVFLFQKIKEHFVLLLVACLLLISNVIRYNLVAQRLLSEINQYPHRHTRRL